MKPTFFPKPSDFRAWLKKNHSRVPELLVGFYKKDSGRPSITWPESVDEALCFGWIDGIRRSLDEESYTIRFTPRRPGSNWSAVNIRRARELIAAGRMQPAGMSAFEARPDDRSALYSYEQRHAGVLDPALERRFRAVKKAWDFFQAQPPGYRRTAVWWVISARKAETRESRLTTLIEDCRNGRRLAQLQRPIKKSG
jgi:uncharacterized protein YdeI (YjbR/CyaY-like superfamily)